MPEEPKKRKTAFVTGGTGILGVPLVNRLVSQNMFVKILSRSPDRRSMGHPNIEFISGDVRDTELIVSSSAGSDVIFHLAAAVHGAASSRQETFDINLNGTKNVVQAARVNNSKMVHVSSVNVHGYLNGQLNDDYSESKAQAEELIEEAVSEGLDAVIVRPATIFGNSKIRGGLIVERILAGRLKIIPAPSRLISPVWADDVAAALIRASESGLPGSCHTLAGDTVTTGDFVRSVASRVQMPAPKFSIPTGLFVVLLTVMSALGRVIGKRPPVTVQAVLYNSIHDGRQAASDLGFRYTPLDEIDFDFIDKKSRN